MGDVAELYDEAYSDGDEPREARCRYCGSSAGLYWDDDPKTGRPVLMAATGLPHKCRADMLAKVIADDFEDID